MDFIPGVDGPSDGVPRVLACFSNVISASWFCFLFMSSWIMMSINYCFSQNFLFQSLLRGGPLKLVDGGRSQRTFLYIKDAIDAVALMIVSTEVNFHHHSSMCAIWASTNVHANMTQDNPERANGHIFNVGNPDNEVSVKELADLMIKVAPKLGL